MKTGWRKTRNDGNICRTARRHNIPHPCQLNRQQIREQYKIAYHRKKTLKARSKFLRKEHLRAIRAKAEVAKNKEKVAEITALMLKEDGRSMWKRINKVTRAPRTSALMRVEREIDGEIYEFTDEQDLVDNIIWRSCKIDSWAQRMLLSAIAL
jgi:transposase-like protein